MVVNGLTTDDASACGLSILAWVAYDFVEGRTDYGKKPAEMFGSAADGTAPAFAHERDLGNGLRVGCPVQRRRFRALTVVDAYTHECPAIHLIKGEG